MYQSEQNYSGQREQQQEMFNNDPREQSAYGEKLVAPGRSNYPRGRGRGRIWLVVLALVILLAGAGALATGSFRVGNTALPARVFNLSAHGKLILTNGSGFVHVHRSTDQQQISIQATEHFLGLNSNSDQTQPKYSQSGDTLTVSEPDTNFSLFGGESIDFEVTVPASTDLDVHTGSGEMTVADVSGQIQAQTGSGELQLQNLSGQIHGQTGSGSIQAGNLTGQVTLTTGSGSITGDQLQLSGNSQLQTGSGDIHVSAALDPRGTYRVDTGSGSVDLTLPANAAFQLQAETGSGDVSNAFGATSVGSDPRASLTVHTGSGNITINKQ